MFMIPEPSPIDYYVDDVSPGFLTDGLLLRFRIGPTHKCVAKYLRPIKRTLSDPVAPIEQLEPRALQAETESQGDGYVESVTRAGTMMSDALKMMPKTKSLRKRGESGVSAFPRSRQYEEARDEQVTRERLSEAEQEKTKSQCEHSSSLPPKFPRFDQMQPTLPPKSVVLCANENDKAERSSGLREGRSMKGECEDTIDEEDVPCECLKNDSAFSKDGNVLKDRICNEESVCCDQAIAGDTTDLVCGTHSDKDRRWQPICQPFSSMENMEEREEELRKLTKPFLHELNTWYTINKPTKLLQPVRVQGKRPILAWRFSHL